MRRQHGDRALIPVCSLVLLIVAPSGRVFAKTFADILGTRYTRKVFGAPFASSIGRSLPVISASAGLVFTFDPSTGVFERETSIVGQLFLERATPLGRGRLNFSLSYQRVKFDTIEGKDIEELSDVIRVGRNNVAFRRFSLDLDTNELTASVTYGVTDDLDLNLTVPVLFSEFRETLIQDDMPFAESARRAGVGDIFLRAKYRVFSRQLLQTALGLVLRVPSGNEDNFQGTGDFEVAPMLYTNTRRFEPARSVSLVGYLNSGVDLDAQDVGNSEGRWGVGLDCGLGERATLAVAVSGRHAFERLLPAGFTSFLHTDRTMRPLFGIEGGRTDIYDFSFGGRVNLWRDELIGFANVILPINREGVRAGAIPTAGVEATF